MTDSPRPSTPFGEPLLTARSLRFGYGDDVLRSVSLSVAAGEWVGLIGPNGSGKSTLLAVLAGQLSAGEGEVRLSGRDIREHRPRDLARALALLPQSPPPPHGITVEELVTQGRYPHRGALRWASGGDRAAVAEAIRLTGLEGFEERFVDRLSGGERQRAWLALTIAQQAPFLLLDEPTTFLDLGHQFELLELIASLREERGLTIVMVLHDLNQAARFCDRLITLDDGRVVAEGTPRDVLTRELLARTFGVDADVVVDPRTGRPTASPFAAAVRSA